MAQDELQKLINLISRLPGIGQRSAQRIALYLIKNKQELMLPLGESVKETAAKVRKCEICGMLDVNLQARHRASGHSGPGARAHSHGVLRGRAHDVPAPALDAEVSQRPGELHPRHGPTVGRL